VKVSKEMVCRLKKSLYGLKQSLRMWSYNFDTFIQGLGFTIRKVDHYMHFKLIGDRVIYLVLYVDDTLLIGNDINYLGFEDPIVLQIRLEGSWCCKLYFGHGN